MDSIKVEVDYIPPEKPTAGHPGAPSELELTGAEFMGRPLLSFNKIIDALNWEGDIKLNFENLRQEILSEMEDIAAQEAMEHAAEAADRKYHEWKDDQALRRAG